MKRCPICNRSSDEIEFIGEFCSICASKRFNEKLIDEIKIIRCKNCGMIKTKFGFRNFEGRNLETILASRLSPHEIHLIDFDEDSAKIEILDKERGFASEKKIKLAFEKTLCERCMRKSGGYFEATIQLRGDEKRMQSFEKRLERFLKYRGEFVARIQQVSTGYDVYVSNKKTASEFISRYNYKATTSYTLHGLKKGKKIYRNTYAIHL